MKNPKSNSSVRLTGGRSLSRNLAALLCLGALGTFGKSAQAASQWWDPGQGTTLGGAGTWDGSTANWAPTSAGGSTAAWTSGNTAIFGGASTYTVTISGTQVANAIQPINAVNSVVTFSGGTVQLGAGGFGSTTSNNNAKELFDSTTAIQLTADQTWSPFTNNAGANIFGTQGSLTDNGSHTLTVAFAGNFKIAQLSGANTLNNLTVNDTSATNTYVGVNFGAAGTATASLGTSTNTTTKTSTIAGTLTLGGTNQGPTFAAVSSNLSVDKIAAGTNTANGGNGLLIGNGGNVTVGYNGGSSTFAGHILNTVGTTTPGTFKKAGAGTLILTGDNSTTTNIGLLGNSTGFSGTWELNGGTLNAGSANALGATGSTFKFTGGKLQYSASNTVDISSRIANSTSAISIDTNSQSVTYASAIASTNTGGLTKSGAGTLTLSASNAFTGGTTISAGTLKLGASGSISSSSSLAIAAGAIFDTTAQSFALSSSQPITFSVDPTGSGSAGSINAANLDITNGNIVISTLSTLDDPSYTLATYSGTLTGSTFASISGVPSGYDVFSGGGIIALVAVPESNAYGIAAGIFCLVILAARRRRAMLE
jgi:autotransporter-associated beta strand protein